MQPTPETRFRWWLAALVLALVYVVIRLAIPFLAQSGIPFEARALLVALLPVLGWKVAPWLYTRE